MKRHLLPPGRYYKANLHTHTNISDGQWSPEETRDAYKALGYSILAITDHSVMVSHQELNQEDFLMLTGTEIEIEDTQGPSWRGLGRERHFCLIAKDPDHLWIPFRDPNPIPRSKPYEVLAEVGGLPRAYSAEAINRIIAESNRQGYMVTYNHPQWSLESYPDYGPMEGLWAMEYRNADSLARGYDENNGQVYGDFLRQGKFLMPVCSDDLHRQVYFNGYRVLGRAWNMIGAEELTYEKVIEAMERGDLYASCGPELHSLTWEEGILHLTCSPVERIQVLTHIPWVAHQVAKEGEDLTEVEFDMKQWWAECANQESGFLRLILTAHDGTYAVTRAYRTGEL